MFQSENGWLVMFYGILTIVSCPVAGDVEYTDCLSTEE